MPLPLSTVEKNTIITFLKKCNLVTRISKRYSFMTTKISFMDGAHAHLLFNHFPVIGSIFSLLVLGSGMILKNDTVKKTALALIILTAALTIPSSLTGDSAEEALAAIGQKPVELIHLHEEMADIALWTTLGVGLFAALTFYKFKSEKRKILIGITFILLLTNSLFLVSVGNAGGQIRHSEIR